MNERLLRAVSDEHRLVLHESLAAIYDAATETFQRPDPAVISAPRRGRTTEN